MAGIRTLEDVYARCRPEHDGCMIWAGAYMGTVPASYWPANRTRTSVYRIAWALSHGYKTIEGTQAVWPQCRNNGCCVHLACGTRKKMLQFKAANGRWKGLIRVITNTKSSRARSKLTEAAVADIRSSDQSAKELALRYGIGISAVYRIRSGLRWGKIKGASVFALAAYLH